MASLNTGQQNCNVGKLPLFKSACSVQHDVKDRFQAIVPAYTFNCSGKVTEWRVCVQHDGSYFIYFQIWRPTITEGCYELVGNNTAENDAGEDVPLRSIVDSDYPCCIVLPVKEDRQIVVQSGDVVGYYVDRVDETEGGLQWAYDSNEVTVYYKNDIRSEDIKTGYALNGLSPSNCWPHISDINNSFSLLEVTTAAPIISLEFGKLYNIYLTNYLASL